MGGKEIAEKIERSWDRRIGNFPFYHGQENPNKRKIEGVGIDDGIIIKDQIEGTHYLLEFLLDEFAIDENIQAIKEYIEYRKEGNWEKDFDKIEKIFEIIGRSVRRAKTWTPNIQ